MAYWIFYSFRAAKCRSTLPRWLHFFFCSSFLLLLSLLLSFYSRSANCEFVDARKHDNVDDADNGDDYDEVKIRICGAQKINISYVFMYLWIGPEQCEIFLDSLVTPHKREEERSAKSHRTVPTWCRMLYAQRQRGRMTRAMYRKPTARRLCMWTVNCRRHQCIQT